MTDKEDSNVRYKTELGAHPAGNTIDRSNVSQKYDFEVETKPVFKRLAEDIYKGKSAGIREPLTNSVTSVIRAIDEGYIEEGQGIIEIKLYGGDSPRLILRDNGVGITRDELEDVVTQIGSSTSRKTEDLTGKFGMGFLATWILTGGTDGGFGMYSNPRGVEEGPFFGFWDSSGFSEMDPVKGSLVDFGENDRGVAFEIFLGEGISEDKVATWVDDLAEWTRVPVRFEYYNSNGVVQDEEYPEKNIVDFYESNDLEELKSMGYKTPRSADDLRYYTVENEGFVAVHSNLIDSKSSTIGRGSGYNRYILMDVPISMSSSSKFPLKSLDVRFNYEEPYVVEGPHEGKFVATNGEDLESLGEDYISESSVTSDDVVTPFPTGTRDHLQDRYGFIDWLSDKMYGKYYKDIGSFLKNVDDLEDYLDLSEDEKGRFKSTIREVSDTRAIRSNSSISRASKRAGIDFDPQFKESFHLLTNSVSFAPEDKKGISRRENRTQKSVEDIVKDTMGDEKEVFMGHRITQKKAEFVWDAERDHVVVRVSSRDQSKYEEHFGWKNLSDLKYSNDLKMSDSTRKKYTTSNKSSTPVEDKSITLHVGSYNNTLSKTASEVRDIVENQKLVKDNKDNTHKVRKLVLFHRTDHNISEYRNIQGDSVVTASVYSDVYDYLKDAENVLDPETIDEGIEVRFSNGDSTKIPDGDFPDEAVYHVVDEMTAQDFRKPHIMDAIQDWLRNEGEIVDEDYVYVPLTNAEYDIMSKTVSFRERTITTQREVGRSYRQVNVESDVELYVEAVLDEEGPEYEALKTADADWSNGGRELVEAVKD